MPQFVSRIERSFGTPLVPMPFARPAKSEPDSGGTSPGMTTWGGGWVRFPAMSFPVMVGGETVPFELDTLRRFPERRSNTRPSG